MEVFEIIVALLLGGSALAALARKIGAPYPSLVALAGAGLAFVPGLPTLVLDPELTLALFIAPVLLDAAYDASPRDLRKNWRPVASLALGAVVLTVMVVAVVARWLVPDLPWAAAVALGAIVAPPDAAAATAVLKQLHPPRRLLVILEGESLFNDASALLIYRLAMGAAVTGAVSSWVVIRTMLVVTLGSLVLGLILTKIILIVSSRIRDVATGVVVQFCSTFAVWMIAERLHLSGIITTVVVAMAAARRVPEILPARMRIPAWAVWDVAVFVLNVLAFVLVGFQLKSIIERTSGDLGTHYALVAAVICFAVIVARIAWVLGATLWNRGFSRRPQGHGPGVQDVAGITPAGAAVVGWCGMRGTVTLAAALALPSAFPQRDLILASAFGVTLGTLVLQGLTLRPLLLRLGLHDDGSVEREVQFARRAALEKALAAAAGCSPTPTRELLIQSYQLQLEGMKQEQNGEAVRVAMQAQRHCLALLREGNTIGDAAFQRIEEELDWMELGWAQLQTSEKAPG